MENIAIEKMTGLSEARKLLLEKRLRGKRKRSFDNFEIKSTSKTHSPLSFTQERLWFVYSLDPKSSAYNIPLLLSLKGTLQIDVLETAFTKLIQRHESLRTNFKLTDGQPVQFVRDDFTFALAKFDLTKTDAGKQQAEAKSIIQSEVDKYFDLENDLLIRASLLTLSKNEHLLIINIQHIIFDGWSIDILFKEFALIYEALVNKKEAELPPLQIKYTDYSVWQRDAARGKDQRKHMNFWKKQLEGSFQTISLPYDFPRPEIQTYKGKTKSVKLPERLYTGLKTLSLDNSVSLYITLLAGFKVLLCKYSGQEDFNVGTFIASRNKFEIENLIGFFANTLVMRTDLSNDPDFIELLRRVRDVSMNAHAHQDFPFERLVAELQPQRNLSYNPLFQVMFDLQNEQTAHIENLEIKSLPVHHSASKFDLSLVYDELKEGLIANIEYNTDLFSDDTIDAMLVHLGILLNQIVADPFRKISGYSFEYDGSEDNNFLNELNNTNQIFPEGECIHAIFERQAASTPDSVALIYEDSKISFHELNEKSNQLANHLLKKGLRKGSLVGIFVTRSIDMVIAMLAVVKAGGAYVPLDPSYPGSRISFMLKDCDAEIILTQKKFLGQLSDFKIDKVVIDSEDGLIGNEDKRNPEIAISSDDIFNIIYTSGSTAQPKGVMETHSNLLNRFYWMWNKYPFEKNEICCQKTALSFVDSIWEIFGPLLKGIPNVIVSETDSRDPSILVSVLLKNKVTRIVLVPSLLGAILDINGIVKNSLPDLKYCFTSGEAVSVELARKFEEYFPDCRLINLYGSSEVAADVTYYEVSKSAELSCIPIGKPIANTKVYILDKNLRQVPVGVPGELFVGGKNLSAGYLKQKSLTDEKFIPNPFSSDKPEKIYRTGDLARFLRDGNIEYKGRVDFQVKIRGFRIELKEIETVLKEKPMVKECIVDAKTFGTEKKLVAYIIPDAANIDSTGQNITKLGNEFSAQWQTIWDDTYRQSGSSQKDFNTIGWNSSYTGKPIPPDEMRIWVDSTVDRIKSLNPRKVLEIGAGTGMLLFKIAPVTEKYIGTDITEESIKYLNEQLSLNYSDLKQVKTIRKKADDFSGMENEKFDTAIMNSVVQYFPGIDYLYGVIESLLEKIEANGSVFIGDVRHFPLLRAFHTSVQLHVSPDDISAGELKSRIDKNIDNEKELIIDPAFFRDLKSKFPEISDVEIFPKRGRNTNEVTSYRYDVKIHVGRKLRNDEGYKIYDWRNGNLDLKKLADLLNENKYLKIKITNVPNSRVLKSVKAIELLEGYDKSRRCGEFKKSLEDLRFEDAYDPEDFWALQSDDIKIDVSWNNNYDNGSFDVFVESKKAVNDVSKNGTPVQADNYSQRNLMKPLNTYANNPLHFELAKSLIPELREHIKSKLPEYMIPSSFVMLESFPLTPSGKINRNALPVPDQKTHSNESNYVEPNDELEFKLVNIWEKILNVHPIGIKDNFFELGGHSLMAVKLFSQIEKDFEKQLPLATLYQAQTIEALARVLRDKGWKPLWSSLVPIQTGGSKHPLFIVHGGGGNVLFCKDLVDYLPEDQPIYGLQSAGLDRSTPPLTTVEEMAEHYVKEVLTIQKDGPYYLAGNCFGGLITFEMARRLHSMGKKVDLLILIEAYNPSFSKLLPSRLQQGINDFKMGGFESIYKKIVWKISFHLFRILNKPLPKVLRSVVRANHRAYDLYRPKPYEGKITLFVASRSPSWNMDKPVFGWEELSNTDLEVHKIPGGHLNIFEKHNIAGLAQNLNECLDKAINSQE